ncbi:MAG TPA: ATP-binding protein, partial [Geothrix sp.]
AERMESLGTLAGGIAHDMNNVLGAVLGLASANIEALPPESRAYRAFDTIARAAIRGGDMVKSLLRFARQGPTEERELDLNNILREEVQLLERTTLSKIRLELDLASDLAPIRGDAGSLTHAFMNLCVNSVHAMPENGTLTLRTRNGDHGWVEVVVKDTGTGMSKEVLGRALEPFFTTKKVGKGTGLGLSLVYSTVMAHHGQMDIQSEPGQGTTVSLRFPVSLGLNSAMDLPVEQPSPAFHAALKVLLVDDDELIQRSTREVLEILGHHATPVSSGEETLGELESGHVFDAVILDLNMPGLGGAETLRRLRTLHPKLPVLLATGRVDQVALDLVEAHPHVTLLSKPFSMKDLQQKLEPLSRG